MAFNKNYSKPSKPSKPGRPGKTQKKDSRFAARDKKTEKPFEKRKPFEKAAPYEAGKPKNMFKADFRQEEEDDDNINLIEGRNPVLEALKSGREIDKIFVQKGVGEGSIRQIIAIAREKKILIKEVDKAKLDGLSRTRNHQGVIASAALYKYYEVDDILQAAREKGEDPFIVILDEITDNNNLGSVLRTAEAAPGRRRPVRHGAQAAVAGVSGDHRRRHLAGCGRAARRARHGGAGPQAELERLALPGVHRPRGPRRDRAAEPEVKSGLSMEFLAENGFLK